MKILLPLLLLVFYARNGFSQENSFKPAFSAVLDTSQAVELLHQCSRNAPNTHRFWKISAQDVQLLEENFLKIHELKANGCCITGLMVGPLKGFGFQYVGVTIKGKNYIYINAFPIDEVKECRKRGYDPGRKPLTVCDGGPSFWGALFDVGSKQFSELSFNGVA